MPPIPQPSGKLIILHPQLVPVPVPVAFSLLRVQVSSETSQPSGEGEIKLSSGARAIICIPVKVTPDGGQSPGLVGTVAAGD